MQRKSFIANFKNRIKTFAPVMAVRWILISIFCSTAFTFVYGGRHEDRLISDIFTKRGYNALARPAENENDTVTVVFEITLQSIINVDEKRETIVTRLWLDYTWRDYKLRWDPADYGGVDNIRLPWDKIWTPDIFLYNSANERIDSKFGVNIIVQNTGECKWIPLGIYTSSCSIDIKWFPFDDQLCKMKFGSWTYPRNLLNLTSNGTGMKLDDYQLSGEWDLIGAPEERHEFFYDCCPNDVYLDITFTLHIRRRTLYYGSNLIIPCALITSLSIMTFALPPDTNAKVSLGITILLALSVFQLIVADMVPSTSMSVPLVGVYFAFLMVMCTISLIITIIVINFHHRKPEMCQMSPFVEKYINNWLAWLLRMSRPGHEPRSPFDKSSDNLKPVTLETTKFMVPALPHPNSPNARFTSYLNTQTTRIDPPQNYSNGTRHRSLQNKDGAARSEQMPVLHGSLLKLKHELGAILNELKFITTQVKEGDLSSDVVNDWKFAAMVIDRFCFVTFTVYLVIATLTIFFSSDNLKRSFLENS